MNCVFLFAVFLSLVLLWYHSGVDFIHVTASEVIFKCSFPSFSMLHKVTVYRVRISTVNAVVSLQPGDTVWIKTVS